MENSKNNQEENKETSEEVFKETPEETSEETPEAPEENSNEIPNETSEAVSMENSEETSEEKTTAPSSEEADSSKKPIWNKTWLWAVIAIVAIAAIVGFMMWSANSNKESQNENNGKVIATVNGEEITQNDLSFELNQIKQSNPQAGETDSEKLKQSVLSSIINQTLLLQEAQKQGISASDKKVNESYQQIVKSFQDQSSFEKVLEKRNLTKADLKENIRDQQVIQEYIKNNINAEQVTVTDKEIQERYNQLKSGTQQQNIPSLDEVKNQIKQQLKNEKQNLMTQKLIDNLKKSADIQKNI